MSDLTEFLLARIAEDEERVPMGTDRDPGPVPQGCWDEDRVLAECEVKRRILERWRVCEPNYDEGNRLETRVLDWTMRLLALPHADHPDYRQEWRP